MKEFDDIYVIDELWDNNLKKWYDICLDADNVASEVLNCEEARAELSVDQMRYILQETGDNEFVYVNENKEIIK